MKRLLAAVTTIATLSSGCSIAFMDKPRVTPDSTVVCDSTMKYPLIDAAVGVVGISTPFILEAMRDRSKDNPNFLLYIPLWVAGAGGVLSAVIGRSRVGRCRDLKDSVHNTLVQPPPPVQ